MKKALITAISIAGICSAVAASAAERGQIRVSEKNPAYMEYPNGSTAILVGANMAIPRNWQEGEEAAFERIEGQMKAFSENGVNFLRVWASHPFYEFETSEGVYDENLLKRRLDRLVKLAEKYSIDLKFCLEHFRTLGNDDNIFTNKIYYKPNGGSFDTMKEYISSEKGRELFLKRAKVLADRYGDNPRVAVIEIWNENNCVNAPIEDVVDWTQKLLPELKKMFPNKVVVQSLGSFANDYSEKGYKLLLPLKGNEIAQVHQYLDTDAPWAVCQAPIDVLASDATRRAMDIAPGRPALLAESGAVKPNHTGPSELYPLDKDGTILHDVIFAPFFSGACGTGQCWHWDEYIRKNNLYWHFSRFQEAVKGVDPIKENFRPLRMDTKDARVYALDSEDVALIWIRDAKTDWKTELRDGKKPEPRNDVRLAFKNLSFKDTPKRVEFYDPWTQEKRMVVFNEGGAKIPEFTRSCVIRIVK